MKNAMERNESGKLAKEWWGCGSQVWWKGKDLTGRVIFSRVLKEIVVKIMGILGKAIFFHKRNIKCKDYEVKMCLPCLRILRKTVWLKNSWMGENV